MYKRLSSTKTRLWRLWSSWDLRLVREITSNVKDCGAIVAVAWSLDQHHLYAVTDDSTVLIWEGSKRLSHGTPKFVNLTSFWSAHVYMYCICMNCSICVIVFFSRVLFFPRCYSRIVVLILTIIYKLLSSFFVLLSITIMTPYWEQNMNNVSKYYFVCIDSLPTQ